jgi:cysteine desulfuration protein SufE
VSITTDDLPATLAAVVREFAEVDARTRLELLLEYADELPPLPGRFAGPDGHAGMEQVHECQTPLFLAVEVDDDRAVHLFFDAPREAPTTRGFAGVLRAGLDGLPAEQVVAVPDDAPMRLGLAAAVSPLRMRGMVSMLARIKRQVRERTA